LSLLEGELSQHRKDVESGSVIGGDKFEEAMGVFCGHAKERVETMEEDQK
jgi:hypothetical protein